MSPMSLGSLSLRPILAGCFQKALQLLGIGRSFIRIVLNAAEDDRFELSWQSLVELS